MSTQKYSQLVTLGRFSTYIFEGRQGPYYMPGWISTLSSAGCDADWVQNFGQLVETKQWSENLTDIVMKLTNGIRLSVEDGVRLFEHPNLYEVG